MIDWNKELDKVDAATAPISEGEHNFKIIDAQATVSSTGNQMIRTTVRVEQPDADAGKTAIVNLVFTFDNPRGLNMTLRRLKNLGVTREALAAENLSIEQVAQRISGNTAIGNVSHREWNGEKQNDVDFIKTSTRGIPSAPSIPTPPPLTSVPQVPTPPAPPTDVPPVPQLPLDGEGSNDPF